MQNYHKKLSQWVTEELWSETYNDSVLLMMFDQIESKNMKGLTSPLL
jgi:hypothetical protein